MCRCEHKPTKLSIRGYYSSLFHHYFQTSTRIAGDAQHHGRWFSLKTQKLGHKHTYKTSFDDKYVTEGSGSSNGENYSMAMLYVACCQQQDSDAKPVLLAECLS